MLNDSINNSFIKYSGQKEERFQLKRMFKNRELFKGGSSSLEKWKRPQSGLKLPGEEVSLLDERLAIPHALLDLLCAMLRIYQSMKIAIIEIIPQWRSIEIM